MFSYIMTSRHFGGGNPTQLLLETRALSRCLETLTLEVANGQELTSVVLDRWSEVNEMNHSATVAPTCIYVSVILHH
jgi:hypothetical protein